ARRHHAQYAFDAEDLHTEEDAPTRTGRQRSARVGRIERRHLGGCVYISAVSQGVAHALADRYRGVVPLVVHNTFAWSDRATIDGQVKDRRGPDVSPYWYSQVIGSHDG